MAQARPRHAAEIADATAAPFAPPPLTLAAPATKPPGLREGTGVPPTSPIALLPGVGEGVAAGFGSGIVGPDAAGAAVEEEAGASVPPKMSPSEDASGDGVGPTLCGEVVGTGITGEEVAAAATAMGEGVEDEGKRKPSGGSVVVGFTGAVVSGKAVPTAAGAGAGAAVVMDGVVAAAGAVVKAFVGITVGEATGAGETTDGAGAAVSAGRASGRWMGHRRNKQTTRKHRARGTAADRVRSGRVEATSQRE